MPSIAKSRRILLDEIGPTPDLTVVKPFGNIGDDLIWEGVSALLSGHVYRTIGVDDVSSAGGELAVICGGGAWTRSYHEYMPEVLAIAEARFERVVVLPSSFEVAEDRTRDALLASKATIFAREHESYRQIRGLCRARLALDCAFYFDLPRPESSGDGELNAFRTDIERLGVRPLPADNDDISLTCESLDDWLSAIARHAVINTDRAHVMIAATMMGKTVNYAPCGYFKVDALAACLPEGLVATPLPDPPDDADGRDRPPARTPGARDARVTIVVAPRDVDLAVTRAAATAAAAATPTRVLAIDRNSTPATRSAIARLAAADPLIELLPADRDTGVAGARRLAAELVATEYTLFLDDRTELADGALDRLVSELDTNGDAGAVAPLTLDEHGAVSHFGGWPRETGDSLAFEPDGAGLAAADAALGASGPTGWVPASGTLVRASLLDAVPIDIEMAELADDPDWVRRVSIAEPRALRRCREAVATQSRTSFAARPVTFVERARVVRRLPAHARFLHTHGLIYEPELAMLMPDLTRPDGRFDFVAARVLLELVAARGTSWTLMEWMNGGLDPLLAPDYGEQFTPRDEIDPQRVAWLEERNAMLTGVEASGWWRLRRWSAPLRRVVGRGRNGG